MTEIPLSVLDQGDTWTDARGVTHRIADMEARYCRHVIAFLERRADEITWIAGLSMARVGLPDEATQAYVAVTESLDSELDRMTANPVAWLHDKPLIKALRQQANKGD